MYSHIDEMAFAVVRDSLRLHSYPTISILLPLLRTRLRLRLLAYFLVHLGLYAPTSTSLTETMGAGWPKLTSIKSTLRVTWESFRHDLHSLLDIRSCFSLETTCERLRLSPTGYSRYGLMILATYTKIFVITSHDRVKTRGKQIVKVSLLFLSLDLTT